MNIIEVIFTLQRDFKQGWGLDQALEKHNLSKNDLPMLYTNFPSLKDEIEKRFGYVSRETVINNNKLITKNIKIITGNKENDVSKGSRNKPRRTAKGKPE